MRHKAKVNTRTNDTDGSLLVTEKKGHSNESVMKGKPRKEKNLPSRDGLQGSAQDKGKGPPQSCW